MRLLYMLINKNKNNQIKVFKFIKIKTNFFFHKQTSTGQNSVEYYIAGKI